MGLTCSLYDVTKADKQRREDEVAKAKASLHQPPVVVVKKEDGSAGPGTSSDANDIAAKVKEEAAAAADVKSQHGNKGSATPVVKPEPGSEGQPQRSDSAAGSGKPGAEGFGSPLPGDGSGVGGLDFGADDDGGRFGDADGSGYSDGGHDEPGATSLERISLYSTGDGVCMVSVRLASPTHWVEVAGLAAATGSKWCPRWPCRSHAS